MHKVEDKMCARASGRVVNAQNGGLFPHICVGQISAGHGRSYDVFGAQRHVDHPSPPTPAPPSQHVQATQRRQHNA